MNLLQKYLYILQLEGYDKDRLYGWLAKNKIEEVGENKQKLKWTLKAKLLYGLATFFYLDIPRFALPSLLLSHTIISFPETLVKNIIITLAKLIIRSRKDLIVIGITGSYGKTSVKEILAHILEEKYEVLKTPESYNTPLGISQVIIRILKPRHQVFIVEMGAYRKGDIKILCDIVHPKIGIITAIGKQHLERFGSQKNITETKFELILSLPHSGKAILNGNDKIIRETAKKIPQIDFINYGIGLSESITKTTLSAKDIKTEKTGISFTLLTNDGKQAEIKTKLLGKHNVSNILAAASAALSLGLTLEDIAKRCTSLSPIPHRLQLLEGANGTTIIDDAFNANPDSAKAALEVLKDFPAERKIIITPGLVELGYQQKEENRIFGEEMAKVADYIVIVGETNRKAIIDGIKSRTMNLEQRTNVAYFSVKNLEEATKKLPEIVIPGAVILFENDLPDQYC